MKAIVKYGSMTVCPTNCPKKRTEKQKANEENLSRGERNGYMSTKAKSKIKTRINHLIFLSQYADSQGFKEKCYLTFLTLTLPSKQAHSDQEIKQKMLKRFLAEIRRKYEVRAYLWVAEAQQNGNIHFHVLLDKYLDNRTCEKDKQGNIIRQRLPLDADYQAITKLWNGILAHYDYIRAYTQKMQEIYSNGFVYLDNGTSEIEQRKRYEIGQQSGWTIPNTCDIHALAKCNNIKAYICKYLTKNEVEKGKKRAIEGALWDCSDNLRDAKNFEIPFAEIQNEILDLKNDHPDKVQILQITENGNFSEKEMTEKGLYGKVKVFATVFNYPQNLFWNKYASKAFKEQFTKYYADLFNQIYGQENNLYLYRQSSEPTVCQISNPQFAKIHEFS